MTHIHTESRKRRTITQRHVIRTGPRSVLHYVVCSDGTRWEATAFRGVHRMPRERKS